MSASKSNEGRAGDNLAGRPLFRTTRRVEFRDTDAAGIVHFSVFFLWMEQVEHEYLRHVGLSVMPRGDDPGAVTWPRVSATCDYRSVLRFEDEFEVEVRIVRIGSTSVTYGFEFKRGDAAIAAGRMTAVCCRLGSGGKLSKVEIDSSIRQRLLGG